MFRLLRAAIPALAVLFPLAIPAYGWGHRRAVRASYYYAAPASYYYAIPVIYSQPIPVVSAPVYAPVSPPVYAVPTPAPAISLPAPTAPPPQMPPAGVKESRSSNREAYYLAPATVVSNTVPVAFWNRSNRDLWVWIAGERRWLGQGRGLTLDLPREFTWQVQGRNSRQERVADNQSTKEIEIR